MSKPTATLYWSLDVDCPKCGESNDLSRQHHNEDYQISKAIFGNRWDDLAGRETTCEHCDHEFELEKVEY